MAEPAASAKLGVLVMAYGTPAAPDQVEAYYTHVRRGRPPTPEQLAELQGRYGAIGGVSPLMARTRAQAEEIAACLGEEWCVELGMKHASPFIEDGIKALVNAGARRIVGLVLAPHYSSMSVGQYESRARATAEESGVPFTMVHSWHLEGPYLDFLADGVTTAVDACDAAPIRVLFTAHSLPVRVLTTRDPYADQLGETAGAVASRAGLRADEWSVAWQSAGRTPEPWIGPDILTVLSELADEGIKGVVVCPCGFVSDHLEVLYDLDIEAMTAASDLGIKLVRTRMPNADPQVCALLAAVVKRRDHDAN